MITPFDFINQFLLIEQTYEGIKKNKIKPFMFLITKLTYLTVCDYNSNKYNSLVVALTIIMVGRKIFKCRIRLPPFLEEICGFSEDVLALCYRKIYFFGRNFVKEYELNNRKKGSSDKIKIKQV